MTPEATACVLPGLTRAVASGPTETHERNEMFTLRERQIIEKRHAEARAREAWHLSNEVNRIPHEERTLANHLQVRSRSYEWYGLLAMGRRDTYAVLVHSVERRFGIGPDDIPSAEVLEHVDWLLRALFRAHWSELPSGAVDRVRWVHGWMLGWNRLPAVARGGRR